MHWVPWVPPTGLSFTLSLGPFVSVPSLSLIQTRLAKQLAKFKVNASSNLEAKFNVVGSIESTKFKLDLLANGFDWTKLIKFSWRIDAWIEGFGAWTKGLGFPLPWWSVATSIAFDGCIHGSLTLDIWLWPLLAVLRGFVIVRITNIYYSSPWFPHISSIMAYTKAKLPQHHILVTSLSGQHASWVQTSLKLFETCKIFSELDLTYLVFKLL